MAKAPRIMIADALDNLDPPELERFRALLLVRREDNLEPKSFKKAQVNNKSNLDLAGRLTSSFGAKAVQITVALLRKVGETEVADELEEEAKEQEAVKPNPDTMSGAVGGTEPGAAADEKPYFVDRHRNALINRVSNTGPLLDYLLDKNVLLQEQYEEALEIRTKQAQMRFLFNNPLKSGGENSKKVLLAALEELEPCLVKDLRENQG